MRPTAAPMRLRGADAAPWGQKARYPLRRRRT